MKKVFDFCLIGGTERAEMLAQADHMEMCAARERAHEDELGLAAELEADAAELRRRAALH